MVGYTFLRNFFFIGTGIVRVSSNVSSFPYRLSLLAISWHMVMTMCIMGDEICSTERQNQSGEAPTVYYLLVDYYDKTME